MDFVSRDSMITIGFSPSPVGEALTTGLGELGHISLVSMNPDALIERWRAGSLSCALIPFIESAQLPGSRLIPGLGVFAPEGECGLSLGYRGELSDLRRVFIPVSLMEHANLVKVILASQANARPEFFMESSQEGAGGWDGEVAGITVDANSNAYPHRLDLGRLWHEQTGLPLPLAVWAGASRAPYAELRRRLSRACQMGRTCARTGDACAPPVVAGPLTMIHKLSFTMGGDEADSLRLLLRWAIELNLCSKESNLRFC